MIMTSVPAQEAGSARSARATPRKVASGPYIPPSLVIRDPPEGLGFSWVAAHCLAEVTLLFQVATRTRRSPGAPNLGVRGGCAACIRRCEIVREGTTSKMGAFG